MLPPTDGPDRQILSVSQVNNLAKELLETLSFWVEGEVSQFKGSDGRYFYLYFTIKDLNGDYSLPAVIVRHTYPYLGVELVNGQKILAFGKLSLFAKSGGYQFIISKVEDAGAGKLAAQLEKLKQQLQKEGLLDQARKRPLPIYPQRVGVVISVASDAWADFQRHSVAKYPLIELIVADSYVQGSQAPASLLRGLQALIQQDVEVIVLTRGGGSAEDLAAFNDEKLVRAIAASPIPTLVGVGHEKDISIADLVADQRASTPTNAGQILTQGYQESEVVLAHLQQKLQRFASYRLDNHRQQLDHMLAVLSQNRQRYQSLPQHLDQIRQRLTQAQHVHLQQQHHKLQTIAQQLQLHHRLLFNRTEQHVAFLDKQLQAVSPLSILKRGYSIVRSQDQVVKSTNQLKQNDTIDIQLHQGRLTGQVITIEPAQEK